MLETVDYLQGHFLGLPFQNFPIYPGTPTSYFSLEAQENFPYIVNDE